ncbi:hypothetical protein FB45DRAFT_802621 [Roridomyces roridus]|uniref:PARP catalytic domain-containing protein n=1 Tax=Roridomyces roridus TaxID=1738132 RepID=A0AAD7B8M3_9AGAR|nr:hypothetical protein FB45DRAFT_802621 [Roridomyces roridus]
MCRQNAKMSKSDFCSRVCTDGAASLAPIILEVPAGHVTFKSVQKQLTTSWRHPHKPCPPVRKVYKIILTRTSFNAYKSYQSRVEMAGQFVSLRRAPGNENRRWHGTKRACNLGDQGQTQLCSWPTCSLCSIIRCSFDIGLFGAKTGWGRFGQGIYTSSVASKSDDYSQNQRFSPLKALLLNKVIVGRGCKLTQDIVSLTAPPAGFDSVLGEKGGNLNYDELVVYTNDAIRPSFLVMYDS